MTERRVDTRFQAPESRRLVERSDRDRALTLPFLPADRRAAISTLYAFDLEIARIRDLVSEPLPGEIRLQWWRDQIASNAMGGSGHPVADELLAAIDLYDLPRTAFDRFLEARIHDLYDDPFPAVGDLEGYAGETRSTLIVLAAMILSRSHADRIGDAAGHAGVAQVVASSLTDLPLHRKRGHCPVPSDLLAAAGCTPANILEGQRDPCERAIAAFSAFGRDHDRAWRQHFRDLPKEVRGAFLPVVNAELVFDAAEMQGAALLERRIEIGPLRRSWRIWRTMRG